MKAASRRGTKGKVKLTGHARARVAKRDLDAREIEAVAEAACAMLNNRSLRFRHKGHTVVASRTPSGDITVITAWK